jgi:L-alanine-DL-glutamate epimerase-like enolase superfamily enzyme
VIEHGITTQQISVHQVYDVRRTIEMRTVALAALRRTEAEAAAIAQSAKLMRGNFQNPEIVMEHDIAFHEAIAAASHNPVFSLIVTAFSGVTRRTWEIGWRTRSSNEDQFNMIKRHEDIAKAIVKGDPRLAAEHMAEHFDKSVKALSMRGLPVIARHEDQRDRNHPHRRAAEPALGDSRRSISGLGETFYLSRTSRNTAEYVAPRVIGRDPLQIDLLSADLVGYLGFRSSGAEVRGNSAFDIALWDIFGKATGQPIAQLLGGFSRRSIRTYNTCAGTEYIKDAKGQTTANYGIGAKREYDDLNGFLTRAGELAEELLEDGITAMKIWPFDHAAEKTRGNDSSAADLKSALQPFEKIRKAVGDNVKVMLDCNQQWSLPRAIRICLELADMNPYWIEEPFVTVNILTPEHVRQSPARESQDLLREIPAVELPRTSSLVGGTAQIVSIRGVDEGRTGVLFGSLAAAGRRTTVPARSCSPRRRTCRSTPQRACPGKRACLLSHLVSRPGDRAAGSEERHDHRAAGAGVGTGAQPRPWQALHRPAPRLRRGGHLRNPREDYDEKTDCNASARRRTCRRTNRCPRRRAQHRLHAPLVSLEHLLAGGEEGL